MDFICEHVVERKKEGLYRFAKYFIAGAWILVPTLLIILCMALINTFELDFLWFSVFLIPLFVFLAIKLGPITCAYGEVSYEYSIVSGEAEFAKIYGDRFRKAWFKVKLSELETVAPYTGMYAEKADNGTYDKIFKAVSSLDAPNVYFGIWTDEDGKRCLLFMELIPKSLKMMRSYNRTAVISTLSPSVEEE